MIEMDFILFLFCACFSWFHLQEASFKDSELIPDKGDILMGGVLGSVEF